MSRTVSAVRLSTSSSTEMRSSRCSSNEKLSSGRCSSSWISSAPGPDTTSSFWLQRSQYSVSSFCSEPQT